MKKLLVILLLATLATFALAFPRQNVILEIGTGTWCTFCPGAAMAADDLVENGQHVAVVEYHSGDSYSTTEGNTRLSYYSMSSIPAARFDGTASYVGGDHSNSIYSAYLPYYNTAYAVESPVSIDLMGYVVDNQLTLIATVTKEDGTTVANPTLFAVVTESDITQSWQGQDHLDFVERSMFTPGSTGTPIDFNSGASQQITLTTTLNSAWNRDHLEVVVFVQNPTTKQIYQGAKSALADLNACEAPQNVAVTHTVGSNSIDINWETPLPSTVGGVLDGFNVYKDGVVFAHLGSDVRSYSDTDCQVGYSYVYSMSATYTNPTGESPRSEGQRVGLGSVTAPTNLSGVLANYNSVTLSWTAPIDGDNVLAYNIYRNDTYVGNVSGTTYTYTENDLPGGDYTWTVKAGYETSDSDPTNSFAQQVILYSPTNVRGTAQPASNRVIVQWNDPVMPTRNLTSYRIYRDGNLLGERTGLSYIDNTVIENNTYVYTVTAVYSSEYESAPSDPVSVPYQVVATHDNVNNARTALLGCYPNPFNPSTTIKFNLAKAGSVKLEVYNLLGQKVRTLVNENRAAGSYNQHFEGRDDAGHGLASGIYYYRLNAGSSSLTGKMVLLK